MSDNSLFETQPWTAVLPSAVELARLEKLASSFFARLEKVQNLLEAEDDSNTRANLLAEKNMLQQVIEWQALIAKTRN